MRNKYKVGDKVNRKLIKKYWGYGDFFGKITRVTEDYYLFDDNGAFSVDHQHELEIYRPWIYWPKKWLYTIIRYKRQKKGKVDPLRRETALRIFQSFLANNSYSKDTILSNDVYELIRHSISIADIFIDEIKE